MNAQTSLPLRSSLHGPGTPKSQKSSVSFQSLNDTPQKKTSSSTPLPRGSKSIQERMVRDMEGYWIGPCPAAEFMEEFLNYGRPIPYQPKNNPRRFGKIPDKGKEDDMYIPLKRALESIVQEIRRENPDLTHTLQFLVTADMQDPKSPKEKRWRPDISTYVIKDRENEITESSFYHQVLPFELKTGGVDPFRDPPQSLSGAELSHHLFEADTQGAQEIRGQIATMLAELFARRFRTHVFSVFMNARIVRFLRADRSGIVVSEAVNYREHPEILENFITRFYYLSDDYRGIDATVSCIPEQAAPQAFLDLSSSSTSPNSSNEAKKSNIWTMRLPESGSNSTSTTLTQVFAREPRKDPEALISRGTRAFYVYDVGGRKRYFLKDGWRAAVDGMESEAVILRELREKGVPHIPTYVTGGDMTSYNEFHKTKSQEYVRKPWQAGRLRDIILRVHYRFLQRGAGKSLDRFKDGQEFVQAMRDALEAHKIAYTVCGLLHRDISANNIMITRGGHGVLLDWEYAKRIDIPLGKRIPHRTGTWYYMSINLLRYRDKPHTLQDDLESFFWVFVHVCLLNIGHNKTEYINEIQERVFEDCRWSEVESRYLGGTGKRELITSSISALSDFVIGGSTGLNELFQEFSRAIEEFDSWALNLAKGLPKQLVQDMAAWRDSSKEKIAKAGKEGWDEEGEDQDQDEGEDEDQDEGEAEDGVENNEKRRRWEQLQEKMHQRQKELNEDLLKKIVYDVPDDFSLKNHDRIIRLFSEALRSDVFHAPRYWLPKETSKRDRSESVSKNDSGTIKRKKGSSKTE